MDDFGVPYYDYGVELSAPSRGVVVWALLREIGAAGMRARCAATTTWRAASRRRRARTRSLELLLEPTLSICCFRYVAPGVDDLDGSTSGCIAA